MMTWTGAQMNRRRVEITDKRDAMTRLLEDGLMPDGKVVVSYDQQWKTLAAAKKYGFVDDNENITDKGRAYVAKMKARLTPYD
jgi:urease accessory protein UreE